MPDLPSSVHFHLTDSGSLLPRVPVALHRSRREFGDSAQEFRCCEMSWKAVDERVSDRFLVARMCLREEFIIALLFLLGIPIMELTEVM